jgi:hypothetical protein
VNLYIALTIHLFDKVITGGLGVSQNLYLGNLLNVGGSFAVAGTATLGVGSSTISQIITGSFAFTPTATSGNYCSAAINTNFATISARPFLNCHISPHGTAQGSLSPVNLVLGGVLVSSTGQICFWMSSGTVSAAYTCDYMLLR